MPKDLPKPGVQSTEKKVEIDESNPYVQLLLNTDFVTRETLAGSGLENSAEYQVLHTLATEGKLSQDQLSDKVDHPLVAVAVRNLVNAELIKEAGDSYDLSETSKAKLT